MSTIFDITNPSTQFIQVLGLAITGSATVDLSNGILVIKKLPSP